MSVLSRIREWIFTMQCTENATWVHSKVELEIHMQCSKSPPVRTILPTKNERFTNSHPEIQKPCHVKIRRRHIHCPNRIRTAVLTAARFSDIYLYSLRLPLKIPWIRIVII